MKRVMRNPKIPFDRNHLYGHILKALLEMEPWIVGEKSTTLVRSVRRRNRAFIQAKILATRLYHDEHPCEGWKEEDKAERRASEELGQLIAKWSLFWWD